MTLCNVYSEFLGKIVPPSSLQMSRTNKIINRMFLKNTKYKTQNTKYKIQKKQGQVAHGGLGE